MRTNTYGNSVYYISRLLEPLDEYDAYVMERLIGNLNTGGPNECWDWVGPSYDGACGHSSYKRVKIRAHRLMYVLLNGPLESGVWVKQSCGNKLCCNPNHLYTTTPSQERLQKYIKENSTLVPESECWEWNMSKDDLGYGQAKWDTKTQRAHRLSYQAFVDPDIDGYVVRHYVCDNPPCTNPEHLRKGSHSDNVKDRDRKHRQAVGEANGRSKLTTTKVTEIKKLLKQGQKNTFIAKQFGVDPKTIRNIKNGVTWKHLED